GLKEDLKTNEYRITIIGEFSSGKSTFINALLGRDILPHGVEETTAAVTYIHNVSSDNPKANTVEVISYDESTPMQILNLSSSSSALIDYVTAKSSSKDVVSEIAEVHIYVPFMQGDEQVVLIDTPGLNGVKEGMRDITYREIHRSHANICLFLIKGASQSDLDFIEQFYKNGTPFFFVLNQIDALNEETPEERIEKFKSDIKNSIIHSDENPDNVFGISALKALTSRDHNIKRLYADDREDLTSEDRLRLLNASRIELFENALFKFVSNGEIEKNFLKNIMSRLANMLSTACQDAQTEIELLKVKAGDLPEKAVLERQKQVVESSIEGNKEIIKNKLSARMSELDREFTDTIRRSCDSISDEAEKIVSQWTDLEKAEKEAKAGKIVGLINDKVNYQRTFIIKPNLEKRFDKIYSDLVDTVSCFVPSVHYSKKTSSWNITIE
ncbi:MAG: dynamin family protein, partial [Allobaculum sp.]|nr:dynamin family protein [Allobaculum sp.]